MRQAPVQAPTPQPAPAQPNPAQSVLNLQPAFVADPAVKIYPRPAVVDMGYNDDVAGWYDVIGQGVPNDYCRYVGNPGNIFLACKLSNEPSIEYNTNIDTQKILAMKPQKN